MLNVVVPMAGRGSRFADVGFELPKPLIEVHGRPMIQLVVENLRPVREHRFVFLCLAEHLDRYGLRERLEDIAPGCEIVLVDRVTEGAACTVLLARDIIDSDDAMMVANSDQWVDVEIDEYLSLGDEPNVDGLIMTMWADHPKWSYVRLDYDDRIVEVVEKEVVSNEATVGVYNFARGRDFVEGADEMVRRDLRVGGEFYVAPVYNQLIERGAHLRYFNVGSAGNGMYGLGTPDDYYAFVERPISRRAAGAAPA